MEQLQRARELVRQGRLHDALEAAQASCEKQPRSAEAWDLLARISGELGLPAASEEARRRSSELKGTEPGKE